jgi:glycine dehydrogenase subunit 2
MNAILGIARPGDFGVDVMHYNTHKTFSTPHGCGGPGAGPIAVRKSLSPYLPVPQVIKRGESFAWDHDRPKSIGKVRAHWGQFNVLVRAYTYIRALGNTGLRMSRDSHSTPTTLPSASHVYALPLAQIRRANDVQSVRPWFITVRNILDRGVTIMDMAKFLIDRGIHPPTVHFPIHDC